MIRRRLILWTIIGLTATLFGCAATIPPPTQADAQRVGVALATLRRGRARYIAKCSGCHRLYRPKERTDLEWAAEVAEMSRRARLSAEDRRAILAYLRGTNDVAPRAQDPIQ